MAACPPSLLPSGTKNTQKINHVELNKISTLLADPYLTQAQRSNHARTYQVVLDDLEDLAEAEVIGRLQTSVGPTPRQWIAFFTEGFELQ